MTVVRRSSFVFIIIIMIMGMFPGCGKDPAKVQIEFLEMIEQDVTETSIVEIEEFLDENLKYMNDENADNMVVEYENYAYSYDNSYIKYDDILKRYGKNISPALNKIYSLYSMEQNSPTEVDGVLQISVEELCNRALELETVILEYKEVESVKEQALFLYKNYINGIVMGTTGTPNFEKDTGNFNKEVLEDYLKIIENPENKDTTVVWVIKEYSNYLDGIGRKLDYNDSISSKVFFDTCSYLVSEAGKRVYQ